jgi:hypothetical protein
MPEVLHSVPRGLQPLPERLVSGAVGRGIVEAVDPVLLLPVATQFQPLEMG